MKRSGWRGESARHSLAARGVRMRQSHRCAPVKHSQSSEDDITEIFNGCGLLQAIADRVTLTTEIKKLEDKARANRPESASKNAKLGGFLSLSDAARFAELKYKLKLARKNEMDASQDVISTMNRRGLVLVKDEQGVIRAGRVVGFETEVRER